MGVHILDLVGFKLNELLAEIRRRGVVIHGASMQECPTCHEWTARTVGNGGDLVCVGCNHAVEDCTCMSAIK